MDARLCEWCGAVFVGRRSRWCSSTCARRHGRLIAARRARQLDGSTSPLEQRRAQLQPLRRSL